MSIDHLRAYGAIAPSPYPSENIGRRFAQNVLVSSKALLDAMSDDQRAELFSNYCRSCGCKDPRCQCWNDE